MERESSKSVRTPGSYPGSIGTPGSDFSIYQNPGGLEVPIFLESCLKCQYDWKEKRRF